MKFSKNGCNGGDGKFLLEMGAKPGMGGGVCLAPTSLFQILSTQPLTPLPCHLQSCPTVFSVVMFLWLNWWSCYILCVILLNDNMDLYMSSLGTLVYTRRTLMYVSCNKASSLLKSDTQWGFLLVLWFDINHTQHTHNTFRSQ